MLSVRRPRIPSCHAAELYEKAFPFCERRSEESHIAKVALEADFFAMELYTDAGMFVGILYYWYWPQHSLLFVEHLAIAEHLRGMGYGHEALRLVQLPGTCVLLEIEPVVDAQSTRRLAFYESAGFTRLPYPHVQLPYHCGGNPVPLELLSFRSDGKPASEAQVALLEHLLHTQVMLPIHA